MACLVKYLQNVAWHLTLQHLACTSHVTFSQEPLLANFLRASSKIAPIFIACLILHHLNTKPNTIKSHKTQGNKLMQLQNFLSWNKANIKYSCKSQLYPHSLHTCHQEPQERTKKIGVKHTETRCGTTMITKCFHQKSKNTTYG